jgi:hypothetical protein
VQTLDELVRDLVVKWRGDDDAPGDGGPGLITRLDDLAQRTAQPVQAGGRSTPGSRPPASLDAIHWSTRIKTEAVVLDQELRGAGKAQRWDRAMKAIPAGAENADRVAIAARTVGSWHSTCLTVLGLQVPARDMRGVMCLACGQQTIRCRADRDRPRAWCTNDSCVDGDTGRPARYDGQRMYLLTTNSVDGRPA